MIDLLPKFRKLCLATVGLMLAAALGAVAQEPEPSVPPTPQLRPSAPPPPPIAAVVDPMMFRTQPVQLIPPQILKFTIDPKTPLKELLPKAPKAKDSIPSAFVDSLEEVPELMLSEPFAKGMANQKAIEAIAFQIAKVNHLNKEKSDRFMEALLADRPDLAGLPFQMGGACRLSTTRSRYFKDAVGLVRDSLSEDNRQLVFQREKLQPVPPRIMSPDQDQAVPVPQSIAPPTITITPSLNSAPEENGSAFLARFLKNSLAVDDAIAASRKKEHKDHAASERIAAMMQICGPTSDSMKLAMARYIASISSADSSRALAKIVLFSPELDARNAAIDALKARRDQDYVDALLQGFRYPWPDVAKRAADALVKLERKDLVSKLIDILDEPDPRAPVMKKADGKSVTTVREIVRINHHRNCLMCHSPGQDVQVEDGILTAPVPVPGQPLSSLTSGYGSQSLAELQVRIDVTYLRQDFSALLPVADASPWPQMQRFDFVVRTRILQDEEAKIYKQKFDNLEPGMLPPNHKAALVALRELTGKDTAPTAEAWRKLMQIPKKG